MVGPDALLVLVERGDDGRIVHHFAAMAGTAGVEPYRWYTLRDGALVDLGAAAPAVAEVTA